MSDQADQQPHNQTASNDKASTAFDRTGPTPPLRPKPVANPGGRPPGPSVSLPSSHTPPPTGGSPPRPGWATPPPVPPPAPCRRRWRIGLIAATVSAAIAAGTLLGHVLWLVPAASTSPVGSSSPIGSGSGGSNSGANSPPPNGSHSSLNPNSQYPVGSGGSNGGGSSQPPSGSGSSLIPTKKYPGAPGGSNIGATNLRAARAARSTPTANAPSELAANLLVRLARHEVHEQIMFHAAASWQLM
jgi:hypothetical protein